MLRFQDSHAKFPWSRLLRSFQSFLIVFNVFISGKFAIENDDATRGSRGWQQNQRKQNAIRSSGWNYFLKRNAHKIWTLNNWPWTEISELILLSRFTMATYFDFIWLFDFLVEIYLLQVAFLWFDFRSKICCGQTRSWNRCKNRRWTD